MSNYFEKVLMTPTPFVVFEVSGNVKQAVLLVGLGLFIAGSVPARGASFDCVKAQGKAEHLICDDPEISKLDEELAASYKAALQNQSQAGKIKQAQKQWMKVRNDCVDAACVKRTYEVRLTKLAISHSGRVKRSGQGENRTDDYVLDPEPKEMIGRNWEEYIKPEDDEVCALYLQNLQYFTRRNEPLSCGQPIAPMLQDKIKRVEWENLNPDQYPELFKAVIKKARNFSEEPSEEEMKWRKKEVNERSVLFRRLKFDLTGSPVVKPGSSPPYPEQKFSIVQYGNDISNSENPDELFQCQLKTGRMATGDTDHSPRLFVAAKDLNRVFKEILDWRGRYLQNVWLINNRIYGESYDEKGDVKLTQLRLNYPVLFEAICLYHFKQATKNKE